MSDIAIDRFRANVPNDIEERAQDIAARFGPWRPAPSLMVGYLESSIAMALERPRWKDRSRLAVDLRVVDILMKRPCNPEHRSLL